MSGEETVVKHPDGSVTKGWLHWTSKGAIITLPDHSEVQNEEGYCYRTYNKTVLDPKGNSIRVKLNAPMDLELKPHIIVKRTYAPRMAQTDVFIYPPATEGWYGRMILGVDYFNYCIQISCKDRNSDENYWLSIFDNKGYVFESYPIKYYEVETISLKDDLQNHEELFKTKLMKDSESIREHYLSILDGPPPPFNEVLKLAQGTPNIIPKLGKTLGETISSIVPNWIDKTTREEIILFLAWIINNKIPKEDRIELFEKLLTLPTAHRLLGIHEFCRIMKEPIPQYVRILNIELPDRGYMYERDQILSRIIAKLPSQFLSPLVIQVLLDLNRQGKIIDRIPDAIESKPMEITHDEFRFLLYWVGLKLEVIPNLTSIGLKEFIYLGAAHQWPHMHTVWSGFLEGRNSRFNSMYFPTAFIEKIKEANSNFLEVDRHIRNDNFSLYKKDRWYFPTGRILRSMKRNVTINDLDKLFLTNVSPSTELLTEKEAYVLDISRTMTFVSNLETGRIRRLYGISSTEYCETLDRLHRRGVIKFQYSIGNQQFLGMMITMKGERTELLPITYSLLKYTPLTSARIIQNGDFVILLIYLPHYLIDNLRNFFKQRDFSKITIDMSLVTKIRMYRHNLFSRLHHDTKGWIDSIRSIESQKRS